MLRRLKNNSGFSLVEMLITVIIYSVVLTAGYLVLTSGTLSWQVNDARVEVQQDLRQAMSWMSADLRQAGANSISDVAVSDTWSTQITFRMADGISGTAINWSAEQYRYYLGGTDGNELKRLEVGSGTIKEIAQNIKTLRIRRPVASPNIIEVALAGESTTDRGTPVKLDMNFWIKLRN